MTILDALLMEEQDARHALDRKLTVLGSLVAEARRAVQLGETPAVCNLHNRADAVEEACLIWQATRAAANAHRRKGLIAKSG